MHPIPLQIRPVHGRLAVGLYEAIVAGDVETVRTLLGHGADSSMVGKDRRPALFFAVREGQEEIVCLLCGAGVDVNAHYKRGVTALHWATDLDCEHPQTVRLLLELGADVNARDVDGWTPLTWALPEKGMDEDYWNPEVVRLLQERGGLE